MSTIRMHWSSKKANDILKGNISSKVKVASILTRSFDKDGKPVETWQSVYFATDQETGEFCRTLAGDLIFNIKDQKKFDRVCQSTSIRPNEVQDHLMDEDFEKVWQD